MLKGSEDISSYPSGFQNELTCDWVRWGWKSYMSLTLRNEILIHILQCLLNWSPHKWSVELQTMVLSNALLFLSKISFRAKAPCNWSRNEINYDLRTNPKVCYISRGSWMSLVSCHSVWSSLGLEVLRQDGWSSFFPNYEGNNHNPWR